MDLNSSVIILGKLLFKQFILYVPNKGTSTKVHVLKYKYKYQVLTRKYKYKDHVDFCQYKYNTFTWGTCTCPTSDLEFLSHGSTNRFDRFHLQLSFSFLDKWYEFWRLNYYRSTINTYTVGSFENFIEMMEDFQTKCGFLKS